MTGKIPVVVVDDEEVDRYIVKRRLSSTGQFGDVLEAETGDAFLEMFFNGHLELQEAPDPLLVLMDVNMPGRDGFETIEEMQRRMAVGRGPESVAVLMFTSSDNLEDRERAAALSAVKGYITKPMDGVDVEKILQMYLS